MLKKYILYLKCPRRANIIVEAETQIDAEEKAMDLIVDNGEECLTITHPIGEWEISQVYERDNE